MTRSIVKAAEWTLGPETAQGATQGIYSAECITCGAQAQPTDNECLLVPDQAMFALSTTARRRRSSAWRFRQMM
uniref:DUF7848 domain-containing protein n=1 Tax=Streptomyces sp. TG1A-60 TaxID=3129111 RepID=UPI00403FD3D2